MVRESAGQVASRPPIALADLKESPLVVYSKLPREGGAVLATLMYSVQSRM